MPTGPPVELAVDDGAGNTINLARGVLELDEIEQGGQINKRLVLRNVSQPAILVNQAACSCECVTFDGLPAKIAHGAVERVDLHVDLKQERSFVGELEVEVLLSVRESSGADLRSVPLRIRFRVIHKEA